MKPLLFISVFWMFLGVGTANAQSTDTIAWLNILKGARKLDFASSIVEAQAFAKNDINNKNIFLCIQGELEPIIPSKKSLAFRDQYNLQYFDFGCSSPNDSIIFAYNLEIIDYLTSTYGLQLLSGLSKNIRGIKLWKPERIQN